MLLYSNSSFTEIDDFIHNFAPMCVLDWNSLINLISVCAKIITKLGHWIELCELGIILFINVNFQNFSLWSQLGVRI